MTQHCKLLRLIKRGRVKLEEAILSENMNMISKNKLLFYKFNTNRNFNMYHNSIPPSSNFSNFTISANNPVQPSASGMQPNHQNAHQLSLQEKQQHLIMFCKQYTDQEDENGEVTYDFDEEDKALKMKWEDDDNMVSIINDATDALKCNDITASDVKAALQEARKLTAKGRAQERMALKRYKTASDYQCLDGEPPAKKPRYDESSSSLSLHQLFSGATSNLPHVEKA